MKGREPLSGTAPETEKSIDAGELFRLHAGFVSAFLVRLGIGVADMDDQAQEVFLVAHRRGGYTPGPARPTTWLAEIALRVALAYRRTKGARPTSDAALAFVASSDKSPSEALEIARSLARVQRALDTVDLEHRAVFVLYEIDGEPCDAIAAALGIPIGTVYSRLHVARRRFAEAHARLERDETSPTGPALRARAGGA